MDQVYVIRHKVQVEWRSARSVARELAVSRNTVRRYLEGTEPAVRKPVQRARPKLEAWSDWALLQADRRDPLTLSPPSILDDAEQVEHMRDELRVRR